MFKESMFPPVQYVCSERPILLDIRGTEVAPAATLALSPWEPRVHLNAHRPQWAIALMRAVLQRDYGIPPNTDASDAFVVYFTATVKSDTDDGGAVHVMLKTSIAEAMACNRSGETRLEGYVRELATPMRLRRVRDAFAAPKPDFFQAGIQRLAERCVTDLMTQPGGPSRQEGLAHLADTAELFASMGKRPKHGL